MLIIMQLDTLKNKDFHKNIKLLKKNGKDYDGGTFMQCYIHPKMDYINISQIIKEQKQNIVQLVKNICINESLHTNAVSQKLSQNEPSLDLSLIPGLQNSYFDVQELKNLIDLQERSFYVQCYNLIEFIKKNKHSWPFIDPVNKDEVPDYYDTIKDPMDIKTIEKNIQTNKYNNKQSFVADLKKIFQNARTYNQPETIYYKSADCLEQAIEPYIHNLKDDQNQQYQEENNYQLNFSQKIPMKNKKVKK